MRGSILACSFRCLTAFCALLFLTAEIAGPATVRGRLTRRDRTRISPAAGVCVTVYKPGGARSPLACANSQGMYYLQDVAPGGYQLEVWELQGSRIPSAQYPITVSEPYTDIPPITLP